MEDLDAELWLWHGLEGATQRSVKRPMSQRLHLTYLQWLQIGSRLYLSSFYENAKIGVRVKSTEEIGDDVHLREALHLYGLSDLYQHGRAHSEGAVLEKGSRVRGCLDCHRSAMPVLQGSDRRVVTCRLRGEHGTSSKPSEA